MKKLLPLFNSATLLALFTLTVPSAFAQDIKPIFKAGIDTGGDTLVTAVFTNGSTDTISANGGFFIGGGVSILSDTKEFETEVSLSYKNDAIKASNGDINWTRYPVDALVFYRLPNLRLGGGLTYHLSPKLTSTGAAGNGTVTVSNALGFMLQADYSIKDIYFIGVRYTMLEYKPTACTTCTPAKSNGAGLVYTQKF